MWIVRIALNRPYTFVVLAVMILFVGPLAIKALGGGWTAASLPTIKSDTPR